MKNARVSIENISFNDNQQFKFSPNDIIVFTGANNAGKSQILREIKLMSGNRDADKKIIKDIVFKKEGTYESLIKNFIQKNGIFYFKDSLIGYDSNFRTHWNNNQSLSVLSDFFINHLTTEERLKTANPPSSFNRLEEQPKHPIQSIYIDDKKEAELSNYFHTAFGEHLTVNRGAGNIIPLHIGNKIEILEGEDRVSTSYLEKLMQLPQLHEQGDGMRSFSGILLNIFTAKQTISLIDEPEAFLHPPQARLLGKMLATDKPNNRQLFISTHSEDFLKGLLDADSKNVKIIRINRENNINHMSLLDNDKIKSIWEDSLLRYSNILSGLFHSKVIICESDTDCRFYHAIMNSLYEDGDVGPDILFTHCGGKARLKVATEALRALKVKVVVIADIDVLNEANIFSDLLNAIEIDWTDIEIHYKVILEYIKSKRPQLNADDVKNQIETILKDVQPGNFPKNKVDNIKQILKNSSAWSTIKETGKTFFVGNSVNAYEQIDEICHKKGLFIVPVGELERFYPYVSGHGIKWVNEVLENVDLVNDKRLQAAKDFVKKMRDF